MTEQTKTDGWGEVDQSITIARPADELYSIWRDLAGLPRILSHVKSVTENGNGESRWVVEGPLGTEVSWTSRLVEDVPAQRIRWRSLPDSEVDNEGSVEFVPAEEGVMTEVQVRMSYRPPAGALGKAVATLFGKNPNGQVADDLENFKEAVEGGTFGSWPA
jgi:uncharacterized membrane protein